MGIRIPLVTGLVRRWLRDRAGAVAVEFALLVPLFLAPLVAVVCDGTLGVAAKHKLEDAAMAAVLYVGYDATRFSDQTSISKIITDASGLSASQIGIAYSTVCYCASTSSTSPSPASVSCSGSCSGVKGSYLSIAISRDFTLLLPYPGLGSSIRLATTVLLRVG